MACGHGAFCRTRPRKRRFEWGRRAPTGADNSVEGKGERGGLPFLKRCSLQPLVGAGGAAELWHVSLLAGDDIATLDGCVWYFSFRIGPWSLHKISSLMYNLQIVYRH
jgi:hypothetical protein